MHWYVLKYNEKSKSVDKYDVFDHSGFYGDVKKILIADPAIDECKEKLMQSLQYWFWRRCEHEIVVSGWPKNHSDIKQKTDVYEQVMLNLDVFADYVFNFME